MSPASEVAFIYDTDALAQIFIAGQQEVLQKLRTEFNVKSFMMNEVDIEFRSNRKFSGLKFQLEKAQKTGLIKLLSSSDLDGISVPSNGGLPIALADIRQLGSEYNQYVQTGEAYTHAAAILLNTPSISNDFNAIMTLTNLKKTLPPTVLRSFDLFGFMFNENLLVEKDVESIRHVLQANREGVPACMKNQSFVQGLPQLQCRLSTSLSLAAGGGSWKDPFFLKRKS